MWYYFSLFWTSLYFSCVWIYMFLFLFQKCTQSSHKNQRSQEFSPGLSLFLTLVVDKCSAFAIKSLIFEAKYVENIWNKWKEALHTDNNRHRAKEKQARYELTEKPGKGTGFIMTPSSHVPELDDKLNARRVLAWMCDLVSLQEVSCFPFGL